MPADIFRHRATIGVEDDSYLAGVADLRIAQIDGQAVAVSVTAPGQGGLAVHGFGADGATRLAFADLPGSALAGVPVSLTLAPRDGATLAMVTGVNGTGLWGRTLDDDGQLSAAEALGRAGLPPDIFASATLATAQGPLLLTLAPGQSAPATWRLDGATPLALTAGQVAGDGAALTAVGTHTAADGVHYMLGAAEGAPGLTLSRITPQGHITALDTLAQEDGPGIQQVTEIRAATVDGRDFFVVGGQDSDSLSVFDVTGGTLRLTDHVTDAGTARFAGVGALDIVTMDGATYVAAGGTDQGLSLLRLLPDGRLLHLGALEDGTETALDGVAGVGLFVSEETLQIVSAAARENGLNWHSATPGATLIEGAAAAEALRGGDGADILRDGAGRDTLTGGAGADIFVLAADGEADEITDFDPAQDRLDLTDWVFFRGVGQLTHRHRSDGAVLEFGDERLVIRTAAGQPLEAAALDLLDPAPVTRFLPEWLGAFDIEPSVTTQNSAVRRLSLDGTNTADSLTGGPGNDTLRAHSGDDLVQAMGGNDHLRGGMGGDSLHGNAGQDTLEGETGHDHLFGGYGADLLLGGAGRDVVTGREGADTLRGGADDDQLWGNAGPDLIEGDSGFDRLTGGLGADTLIGGDGADLLSGSVGGDLLRGGAGGDLLQGNAGRDTLEGGAQDDLLRGGIDHDTLVGGLGSDSLHGGTGDDSLAGGGGNDLLKGNAGDDRLSGGAGDDLLHGGLGADVFLFDQGNDRVLDFDPDDMLLLSGTLFPGGAPADLLSLARPTDAGVWFDLGAHSLTLLGLTLAEVERDSVDIG